MKVLLFTKGAMNCGNGIQWQRICYQILSQPPPYQPVCIWHISSIQGKTLLRPCRNAAEIGVGTPQPVGYMNIRSGLLFDKSYYISLLSTCPYIYDNLFTQQFDYAEEVFRAIGKVTARLHEHGYAHKDYGRANILFQKTPNGITIEIVDLNRMYIGPIDMKTGCKNFERLPATPQMHRWMAEEYAKTRNFDVEKCFELMRAYRSVQPGK